MVVLERKLVSNDLGKARGALSQSNYYIANIFFSTKITLAYVIFYITDLSTKNVLQTTFWIE